MKLARSTLSYLSSNPPLLESVELLISHFGSLARVIISLQMLKFGKEPKGSVEQERNRGKKYIYTTTSSTPVHEVIYSSLPKAPSLTSSTPLLNLSPPFLLSALPIQPHCIPGGSQGRLCLLLR